MKFYNSFKKLFLYILSFIHTSFDKFLSDECSSRSAATTYVTILTLVPLTTVIFSIFTSFKIFDNMKIEIQSYIFTHLIPDSELSATIGKYLTQFGSNTKAVGILGAVILFASAIILISQIEYNLNALWGTPKKRALLRRIFTYYPVITIIPFLIAGSLYLSTNIQSILNKTYYASILYNMIAPYLMITIAFIMMYKTLPNTQVEWKAAIISGITAAVLWENSKMVFTWYIKEVVSYDKIYGSLSILPIFLLYIFLCWLIIYFAAEVGVVAQNFSGQKAKKHFKVLSVVDYISVLHLICLNQSDNNKSTKLAYISKSLSIPNDTLIQIVDHLESLEVISKTGRHQYSPTKPLEDINLSNIIDAFLRINPDSQYIANHPKYADFIYKLRSGTIDLVKDDNFKALMKPL